MTPFNFGRAGLNLEKIKEKRRRRRKGVASAKPPLASSIGRARHTAFDITTKVSV
jgi:hypothetical protein